jgi:hypothetical protein
MRMRLARMGACRWDLVANGIDVARTDVPRLRRLAFTHRDYFQLMLGYDAGPAEIVTLLKRLSHEQQVRPAGSRAGYSGGPVADS